MFLYTEVGQIEIVVLDETQIVGKIDVFLKTVFFQLKYVWSLFKTPFLEQLRWALGKWQNK